MVSEVGTLEVSGATYLAGLAFVRIVSLHLIEGVQLLWLGFGLRGGVVLRLGSRNDIFLLGLLGTVGSLLLSLDFISMPYIRSVICRGAQQ